ncbi:F-box protein At3g07870-like [Mercurialis annua]|uniref:F-box protein At3g07870-like n=1 Tax=Mercurialis annua TaxID=3986 RepID=UPI00215F2A36|nr:F-box protein At3g07870-like [Mercurialis annua]
MANNNDDGPCVLLHCDFPVEDRLYSLHLSTTHDHTNIQTVSRLSFPVSSKFVVLGSCNGLLYLQDSVNKDQSYIYNPFTRDCVKIPKPGEISNQHRVAVGFGLHSITKEYKVVRIVYSRNNEDLASTETETSRKRETTEVENCETIISMRADHKFKVSEFTEAFSETKALPQGRLRKYSLPQSEVQVLTLGGGNLTWRSKGEACNYQLLGKPSEALVNGKLHWLSCRYRQQTLRKLISFDLEDEQFREVPNPCPHTFGRHCSHLVTIRGCLAAVIQGFRSIYIWIMKEYGVQESWSKELSLRVVQLDQSVNNFPKFSLSQAKVLCALKNGEVLIKLRCKNLVCYDPKSGEFKELNVQELPESLNTFVHLTSLNWIDTPIRSQDS